MNFEDIERYINYSFSYFVYCEKMIASSKKTYWAEVRIELKKGVADPEGDNTKKALELLGFREVKEVKSVKVFEIYLSPMTEKKARARLEEMGDRLLANPVIHNYSISLRNKK